MFDKESILKKANELGLSPNDVEKDYIQSWIIREIFQDEYLAPYLTLKGSAALRKFHDPETRLARDIDLSSSIHIDEGLLEERLRKVTESVQRQTGIEFVDGVQVAPKELPDEMKEEMNIDALEAKLMFKTVSSEGRIKLKTQVDVTQRDVVYLPPKEGALVHPYFDSSEFAGGSVRVQRAEEIVASKIISLSHRRKPTDLWDLFRALVTNPMHMNQEDVVKAILSRTNFSDELPLRGESYLNLPLLERYERVWGGLLVPVSLRVGIEQAISGFKSVTAGLFDAMVSQVGNFARRVMDLGRPALSDAFREVIIKAGAERHVLKMIYKDEERFVQPYKFEFYQREKDKETNEYFWNYDLADRRGKPDKMKTKHFFAHKIQHVEETDEIYIPKWDVEF